MRIEPLKKVVESCQESRHNKAWLVHEVLSKEECEELIRAGESKGFQSIEHEYPPSYRNNKRLIWMNNELADKIYTRVSPLFANQEMTILKQDMSSFGYCLGRWQPVGLNECFRFCKYEGTGHFKAHCDTYFQRNKNERSFLTFMIYLNDNYEGGATSFLKSESNLKDTKLIYSIKAPAGSALVFTQQTMLHQGDNVIGDKYILRTDLMFQKDESFGDEETELSSDQALGIRLMKSAEQFEASGNLEAAVEMYKRAYKLYPQLEFQ